VYRSDYLAFVIIIIGFYISFTNFISRHFNIPIPPNIPKKETNKKGKKKDNTKDKKKDNIEDKKKDNTEDNKDNKK
jgi:hypothetical protein